MGMGVSGGEQGARRGPSIMPGGDLEVFNLVKPMLEVISAKVNGSPVPLIWGKELLGIMLKWFTTVLNMPSCN
ncbi:6-phosphogluconate dehydrogenase, decarboxylating 2 [Sphingobacterium multivorum]|uniref:6-phosphogluconate dehydrogenase, decarboxylating 2 n=1 Tax=Sphingobacterium multivorum TaxID=28454 RepID=A0A2X2J1Y6_SPHMU|nr:6-phosphogluconate dehydrogenase, decarboxylating 2 [Sphingobacterium multivorum]